MNGPEGEPLDDERQNEQLLSLSNQILALTQAIHAGASTRPLAAPAESDDR